MIDEEGGVKSIREEIDPYNEEQWDYVVDIKPQPKIFSKLIEFFKKNIPFFFFLFGLSVVVYIAISIHKKNKKDNMTQLYFNEYFIVKEKIPERKVLIIQRLADTNYFAELPGHNLFSVGKWDSIYYSKKIGDKVFFEHIRKDRFFKTTNGIINK